MNAPTKVRSAKNCKIRTRVANFEIIIKSTKWYLKKIRISFEEFDRQYLRIVSTHIHHSARRHSPSSHLKMKAACSSKMLVYTYQTTRRNIPSILKKTEVSSEWLAPLPSCMAKQPSFYPEEWSRRLLRHAASFYETARRHITENCNQLHLV
jgi:hypothetical protein